MYVEMFLLKCDVRNGLSGNPLISNNRSESIEYLLRA